jgi:hypothetical protein
MKKKKSNKINGIELVGSPGNIPNPTETPDLSQAKSVNDVSILIPKSVANGNKVVYIVPTGKRFEMEGFTFQYSNAGTNSQGLLLVLGMGYDSNEFFTLTGTFGIVTNQMIQCTFIKPKIILAGSEFIISAMGAGNFCNLLLFGQEKDNLS